jgi:hypothetical protein
MNDWFLGAAGLSAFTFVLHVVAGGRETAGPLLESTELGRIAKYTSYYCWHLVTISIASIAAAFLFAAQPGGNFSLAAFATGLSFAFAVLNIAIAARFGLPFWEFGQWVLFLGIALLGLAGLLL